MKLLFRFFLRKHNSVSTMDIYILVSYSDQMKEFNQFQKTYQKIQKDELPEPFDVKQEIELRRRRDL